MDPEASGGKSQFNLSRYLPQELITKLEAARSRNTMVGERRVITMLFCDVKGSTAAAEKVDPEIWSDIMNGVFEYMIRPIYKYEGLVPRLMGDAILAFFGAPITHEDDPQRAVLAALEIQQGIKSYADEIRLQHGLEFGLRVGINTGLVVVGEIGSDLRMEYTAIGDAINLAARMEQTAPVGTIQISDDTYKLVAPFFEVEPLGVVEVKGKAAPVKTYRVIRVKSTPGQLRGLEGMTSPLVGRDDQLILLNDRLKDLDRGTGSVVAVVGEAGLGKSTLVAELKKSTDGSRYSWLRGDSLSYTRSITYYPWRQIIRQSVDAHDDDSPAEVRHKLGYVCDCCTLPGGDIPFLEAMLAVESEESSKVVMGIQGDELNQRMIDATRGFLCGLAVESPLVIVFDDLHWADEASLNLLLNLVDLSAAQPIVFICMSRPDKTAASWDALEKMKETQAGGFYPVDLAPLQVNQTETLLANLLGVKDLPNSIRDLIVEKAEGNPFFIEEIIRSLIETKQIVRENSHWRAVREDANVSLPNTLRGVLGARIDRLPESSKHVLQNAAVIGRLFDLRILKRLTGLNGGLEPHIHYLKEASLIEATREEYAFRHVLIQEAAYESILIKNRTQIHKQIGETLEELHADRIEEFAPLLAHHFYSAGDGRSLAYDVVAGEKAARLYANAEAATHFRRALEVARRSGGDAAQITHLFNQLGQVFELAGRYEQALENYNEMQAYGLEHDNRSMKMSALMSKATIYSIFSRLHNPELSANMLVDALAISRELGDRATQAKLNWNLMLNYLFSKRFEQALEHGGVALALARETDNREQLAFVLNDLCRLYTCLGRFEDAYASIQEARSLWRALDHQVMLADSYGSEAEARFNAAEFDLSFQRSKQALQISEQIKNIWGQSYDRMLMAFVRIEQGVLGEGIQLAGQSTQLSDGAGLIASSIGMRSELAWTHAYCGDFDTAYSLIEQALQVADSKQPRWRAFPQAGKVRIQLLQGDLRSANHTAGDEILQPISIPYARYTIFLFLANIELAVARGEYDRALSLVDGLLEEVTPLTRVDIPEVLRWRGIALLGLSRLDEARQVLIEAWSLAKGMGANLYVWLILAALADVNRRLGMEEDADVNRAEARRVIEQIADSLRDVGLSDSFINQPRVHELMR
ncbi:MAG TPA: adenylate/guanylate cyclase domain-containing protein [Anaerolineales bacterium]|nr:adenylate/guanylate cyclase domain-containing protein [Anaerolineales bacterium]